MSEVQHVGEVRKIVDNLFRTEYGKIVSFLTKKFGSGCFELAEDSVQEAMFMAMKTWPLRQIPDNPTGWIFRAANNKMIDKLRKTSRLELTDEIKLEQEGYKGISVEQMDDMLKDELLQMLFACCHPSLSVEYQIILSLKVLCGLSVKEIAACLLKKESTIAKSYTRGKQRFAQYGILPELPSKKDIATRLSVVQKVIYLLFNEGYKTSSGDQLYDMDLCGEAIRLGDLLLNNSITAEAESYALVSLMCLHMARFESRIGVDGDLVTLEEQDRSKWDRELISRGTYYLNQSIQTMKYSEYHVQAAIAAVHCDASSYEETNWHEILTLYDALLKIKPSPVAKLNRLVPLSKVKGAKQAVKEIHEIENSGFFDGYYLFHVIKGQLHQELGSIREAEVSFRRALELTDNTREQEFLRSKINKGK